MIGREQLAVLRANLHALGPRRLFALAVMGLTVFGAVGLASYYLSRPELETLYGGLNAQDVSRIGAVLGEAGIHFDVNSEGTKVLVRPRQTAHARMLLAEKGLPSSANAGYELFDKMGSIGLTSFMQEITRVRALEGEIARTIQAVKGIRAARVHIVLPDAAAFRRARQGPSASVVIRTDTAGDFSSAQAIRHLVAAAVPGMGVDHVTVISTDGAVMATAGDAASAAPARLVDLEKALGRDLQEGIRKTLAPYLGLDNFEVSVAARLNADKRQVTETAFDPESRVERSVRVVKETGSAQNQAARTPAGVEQNIPVEQAGGRAGDQSTRSNERREELTNFELNSKSISTVSEGYRVEALTVAVVINRKRLLATLGDGAGAEALEARIKEIERLVGTAVGVAPDRGDRITVMAVDFLRNTEAMEPVPAMGIGEALLRQTGTFVNAIAILVATALLIWLGLRPVLRMLLDGPRPVPIARLPVEDAAADPGAGSGRAESARAESGVEPSLIADLTSRMGRTPQRRLEQIIDYDEEQAAAVLRQWMREARQA